MKRIIAFAVMTVVLGGFVSSAAGYDCEDGSGHAVGFVEQVSYSPNLVTVTAVLQPSSDCACASIRVEGTAASEGVIRGVQALLLTALTTGLPIKFDYDGTAPNDCVATKIVIAKPDA